MPQGLAQSKTGVVLGAEVRRAFERHGAADVVVGGLDLGAGEAEVAQEVEGGVAQLLGGDAEDLGAELLAERPLVEDEADVEGGGERRFELLDLGLAEAVADERGVVDLRRLAERAVADGVGDDLLDLGRACSRGWRARRGPRWLMILK